MSAHAMKSSLFVIMLTALLCAASTAIAQAGGDARYRPQPCSGEHPCASVFEQNGLFGVRNAAGEVTIPPTYPRARMASELFGGLHGLIFTYNRYNRIGLVGRDGRELSPPRYTNANRYASALVFSVDGDDHTRCAFDLGGRQITPCEFTRLAPSSTGFSGDQRGTSVYFDYVGRSTATPPEIVQSQAALAASRAREAAAAAAPRRPVVVPLSPRAARASARVRALVDARDWEGAMRAAIAGNVHDQLHALLEFYTRSSESDAGYAATLRLLEQNLDMLATARSVAEGPDRVTMGNMNNAMSRHMYMQELRAGAGAPSRTPGGNTYIPARTVGECHSSGGTVSAMGYCRR